MSASKSALKELAKHRDARREAPELLELVDLFCVIWVKPERHSFPSGVLFCVGPALGV